ncbi:MULTISPECIES: DNA-processing protein DprA [Lachnospiraceae]|uniref:DNA-processing protein DprA n=1 Tax=Lachnospiraceae TaxID=186803 RepID=UPI001F2711FD|nr:DNA-processing protein DprA [Faecalicatena contorta]MCF2667655.1 DNA-protecting protein DprA [Faecalicatena contorta]MCI6535435.1 DNA-processing protein DprA [Lachnospiraceae bacterium]MDY4206471.1 DNA-processing protein DprA [Lachnospiraceae bacterium]
MMYEYWLSAIRPLSDKKKRLLREEYGDGKTIYNIEEIHLRFLNFLESRDVDTILRSKKEWEIEKCWEKLQEQGIRMIPYFSEEYPKKLTNISQPPYALYVKGSLPRENQVSVAIVGARRCTHYGEQIALEYGEALASEGIQIISGMARGIDGAGQRGALNAGGATYGVLGCGVDICYPRENIGLYMDIQQKGGIISEQIPGQPPLPAYFPERNRIISGLADVVLVIEAKEKSGSLITADMALEQGKDVYALPGPVTSSMSQGCHRLIRQGAGILISPEDLLIELGINIVNQGQIIDKNEKVLESTENMVYSCLGLFPKGMSQLLEETGLNVQELLEQLITLEMKGYVKEISKNYYVKLR